MSRTREYLSAFRTRALLALAAALQLVFSAYLHRLFLEADEVHVWCPEHQRLEHRHAPPSRAMAAPAPDDHGRFLNRQQVQDDHHAACPLFLLTTASWTNRGLCRVSQGDLVGEAPRPTPAPPPALAVILFAPKTSPPGRC